MSKSATKKPKSKPREERFRTIRVTSEIYDLVHKIVGDVNSHGWQHFGTDRRDAPSITSVVAEALTRLGASRAA